jgi:hypothetical protein
VLNRWTRDIALAIQARSGASPALFVWIGIIVLASLTAFAFLCVSAYDWLSLQLNAVYAGLVMAGVFLLIAVFGAVACAVVQRRARERAILERAARAHAPPWLLDPKILGIALSAGRALGWQRLVPVALLGFMAVQWARDYREHERKEP